MHSANLELHQSRAKYSCLVLNAWPASLGKQNFLIMVVREYVFPGRWLRTLHSSWLWFDLFCDPQSCKYRNLFKLFSWFSASSGCLLQFFTYHSSPSSQTEIRFWKVQRRMTQPPKFPHQSGLRCFSIFLHRRTSIWHYYVFSHIMLLPSPGSSLGLMLRGNLQCLTDNIPFHPSENPLVYFLPCSVLIHFISNWGSGLSICNIK